MSAREPAAFASLYYTDCLPGQGLGGGAGFGFQARSEGAGEEEQRLVQRGALYEVPVRWMRDRRPVADFPPSLAHLHDGVGDDGALNARTYVTAGGRYLGREANGYRDGNQFTHAVVAREAGSYGLVRPAQLWGASWWVSAPAPTTSCAPVPAHPDPGPWDTETVRERIAAAPDGRERLLALVTALGALRGGADRRRVLLVTDRGDDAACWLAAATLLLDRERALAISFKIFATDPDRSPHDVVVAHPDWAGPYRRQDGYLVLDLLDGAPPEIAPPELAPPEIAPSAEALFWVPLFLGADDPLDVVDAVEVAGQLAREGRADGPAVAGEVEREAAALTVGLPLGVDPGAAVRIARWLRTAGPGAVDVLGAPLVGTLVAQTRDHTALVDLDAVAATRAAAPGAAELGWDAIAEAARRRLFDREADLAADGGAVPDTPLRPVAGEPAPADAPGQVAALERVAQRDPAAALVLAHRHALPVPDGVARRFVGWWADHPDADVDPDGWVVGPTVVSGLHRELERRLGEPDLHERTAADVDRRWWRRPEPLAGRIPVLGAVGRLDLAVARAALVAGGEPARAALAGLAAAVVPGPNGRWVSTWERLLGRDPVDNATVRRFLEALPPQAHDRALAVVAYHSLTRAPAVDEDARAALDVLEKAGLPPRALGHQDWPPADASVTEVVERLEQGARLDEARDLGLLLAKAARPTRADRNRLVRALRGAGPSVGGRVLVAAGPSTLRDTMLTQLYAWATGDPDPDHAPDPRSTAVLFVFAAKETAVRARVGHGHLTKLDGVRSGLDADVVRAVTDLLADDRERAADDGVLELWQERRRPASSLAAHSGPSWRDRFGRRKKG